MAAAMASSTTSATTAQILQRFLHPAPRQPSFPHFFLLRSIRSAATGSSTSSTSNRNFWTASNSSSSGALFSAAASHPALSFSTRPLSPPPPPPQSAVSPALTLEDEEEYEDGDYEVEEGDAYEGFSDEIDIDSDDEEDEGEEEEEGGGEDGGRLSAEIEQGNEQPKLPELTVKEKKELASYAHGLGDKLKSQLVGKSGVTANVAASFVETLEANELLKIKIHRTCPGELDEVVQQLEKLTGSTVVGQIGRTVIIYRPSISKMKAEEKRRQARKIYARRSQKKPTFRPPVKVDHGSDEPRTSGRGRRGNSRFR